MQLLVRLGDNEKIYKKVIYMWANVSLCQERREISMFLKRIVSAVSALTIAVSTFAGLTLTASAVGVPTVYNVTYKTEISQVEVGEKTMYLLKNIIY